MYPARTTHSRITQRETVRPRIEAMDELTITKPDDWHLHLRDGEHMRAVVADSARRFARAVVMPNLKPPVTTTALALAYRQRILEALPGDVAFQPLMTLYLTPVVYTYLAQLTGWVSKLKRSKSPAGALAHVEP